MGRSRGDRRLRLGAVVFGDRVLRQLNRVDRLEGVERVVTAGLAGSVLNGLDCQAVLPASSSLIELCGLERSKRVSFVIGLKSLVVVFGRRALSASDRGGIGIRWVVADRRVASVIELIGLRALDWGFRRSVAIGGSRRERPFSVRGGLQPRSRSCSGSAACPRSGRLAVDGLSVGGWSGSDLHACRSRAAVSADLPVVSEVLPPRVWGSTAAAGRDLVDRRLYPALAGIHRCESSSTVWGVTPFWRGSTGADGKTCSSAVVAASSDCWFGRQRLPLPRVFGARPVSGFG